MLKKTVSVPLIQCFEVKIVVKKTKVAFFKKFQMPFFKGYWKILSRGYSNRSRTSPVFFLFKISQQIWSLEASKVLAEMGRGWQADWAMAKIFFSNLRKHVMNKCWKFQADISIRFWFRAKWLKICCNQWTHVGQMDSCWTTWVHWLQQIFSHLALNQNWIETSPWNFQHLFITCLRKFNKKILAIAQSACTWDISKRKKMVRSWTHWSNLLKGLFNIS